MASWFFVELVFGIHGYFKIVKSGYSYFLKISSSDAYQFFFQVSLIGTHQKNSGECGSYAEKEGETNTKNEHPSTKLQTYKL